MNRLTRSILEHALPAVFTAADVKALEPEDNARYRQMRNAFAAGDIVRICRGYYTLNRIYGRGTPCGKVLAQKFVPDSYISLESALREANWIPEAVYVILSVTSNGNSNKTKTIKTPVERFYYVNVPQKNRYAGTERILHYSGEQYVTAKPLKALADSIYERNLNWTTLDPLVESLRVEIEDLESLTAEDFNELEGNYESSLVENFLSGIRKELRV
jgi:hypothetical protein